MLWAPQNGAAAVAVGISAVPGMPGAQFHWEWLSAHTTMDPLPGQSSHCFILRAGPGAHAENPAHHPFLPLLLQPDGDSKNLEAIYVYGVHLPHFPRLHRAAAAA